MVKQTRIFLAICAGSALLVGAYLFQVKRQSQAPAAVAPSAGNELPTTQVPDTMPADSEPVAAEPVTPTPSAPQPAEPRMAAASQRIFFRYTGVDSHYGKVAWNDRAHPKQAHFVDTLNCEVVYVAGGHGICLSADRGVFTTYNASLFDAKTFKVSNSFPLKGIPSRARISIDGTLAAFTVFVTGHGYSTLDFSTQSLLIDTGTGATLADLEDFEVRRDGTVIKETDFNFWGVTFTPDARGFFATLSTAGQHFLVRGDIAARRMEIIHENVECPSLSPDARHVAYKKRLKIDNRILWQLQVLELQSGREIALSERRSIDDQLEWLDDRHVLYSVPAAADDSSPSTNVWIAPIDGKSAPRLFIENAYSPAAVRCKDPAACAAAGS